jgi:hypothetical protein
MTNAQERESARRVLEEGAFDCILLPPESEQTVKTIGLALWHSKLMMLISCKERVLETYREHLAAYPLGNDMEPFFKKSLSAIQSSIVTYQKSIVGTEGFAALAMNVKTLVRTQALERLKALPR